MKLMLLAFNEDDQELALEVELMRLHYYVYRKHFQEEFIVKKIKDVEKIILLQLNSLICLSNKLQQSLIAMFKRFAWH